MTSRLDRRDGSMSSSRSDGGISPRKAAILEALRRARGFTAERSQILPRDKSIPAPLSYAQQRLWFIEQMEPGSPAYIGNTALRLRGKVRVDLMKRAVQQLVERHDMLRTSFAWLDGEPVQEVQEHWDGNLEMVDLRGASDPKQQLRALIREDAQRPCDFTRGSLFRVTLFSLDDEEWVLLLTLHHIASDGWSMGIVLRELSALYGACVREESIKLRELPVQYADFAVWQREWLRGGALEEQMAYWRAQLQGTTGVLELPTDYQRPLVKGWRGKQVEFVVGEKAAEGLRRLGHQVDATLFMTLLAALQTMLWRYTGQNDISIGTPIANRNRDEIEGLVGFFVNMLVMRAEVNGEQSFVEHLRKVREVALGAYEHQDVPFEKLVEELQLERDPGRTPLFQVTFSLQNLGVTTPRFDDLDVTVDEKELANCNYDLLVEAHDGAKGLRLVLHYDVALFADETIRRMCAQLGELLVRIAENPGQSIAQLSGIGDRERSQVLEWNATERAFPRKVSVHEVFEALVKNHEQSVAVVSQGKAASYGELNRRANQMAHYLREQGVGSQTLVGVCVERSLEMVVALLGILKAGGAYMPLDAEYPQERLAFMLSDSGAQLVITEDKLRECLASVPVKAISIDGDAGQICRQSDVNPKSVTGGEDLAYVMYTSGSTGQPKGVMIPHRGITRLVCNADYVKLGPNERLLQMAPVSFDASTFEIWGALLNGGRLVLMPAGQASLEEIGKVVKGEGVTVLWLTAALFDAMVRERVEDLSGVKQMLAGGDVVTVESARKYLAHSEAGTLINGYGPTEGTTFSCCHGVTELESGVKSVPIGKAIANTQAYIADQDLRLALVGTVGELYLGGEGLGRGYWKQAELTAEKFVPNPYSPTPGARLYRTGDRVRYGLGGAIEFLGRIDEQVKIRGHRIEPGEIQRALTAYECVREAVVATQVGVGGEKQLVAYVVLKESAEGTGGAEKPEISHERLREYLQGRLPEYMVPWAIVTLKELPLTANGKVDRRRLPKVESAGAGVREYEAPRTAVQEILCGVWSELLHVERVGIHDSFFELGGHSLLATRLVSRVRRSLHVELPLRKLFEEPTVAGLAQAIEEQSRNGKSVLRMERVSRERHLPLSYAQQRLWFIDQLEPGNAAYNISMALWLKGKLRVEALQRAIDTIVRRHEVLRTYFAWIEGGPVQVIAEQMAVPIEVQDLPMLDSLEREAEIARQVAESAAHPFDLRCGPLLRVRVVRAGEREQALLLCMHHIVSDGWSIGILLRELSALYAAYIEDRHAPLAELPVQYADFSVWQREWLEGGAIEEQLGYWREQLRGTTGVLGLPVDYQRPLIKGSRGRQTGFGLDEKTAEGLRKLGRQADATLFMTLLAGLQALLWRYTGESDISVGTPIANRNREEIEGLIGFFVNMLVMRSHVQGQDSFVEHLQRVRSVALGAYEHQDVPFEKLVEEVQLERDPGRTPLFQVTISLQNADTMNLELHGLTASGLRNVDLVSKYDLSVEAYEAGRGLGVALRYDPELFTGETMERMGRHLSELLQRVAEDPEARIAIADLTTMGGAEREQVLEWNRTDREYGAGRSVQELFEDQVRRCSERIALVSEKESVSYRTLNQRAN